MTGIWLRIGLVIALIASLFVGIWDFFQAPSKESAVAALIPTVEKVERAKAVTDPVVTFVSEQDAASVAQLIRQAEAEFDASLTQPGAPVAVITEIREIVTVVKGKSVSSSSVEVPAIRERTTQEASGSSTTEPGTQPGIEWYRDN
ncbi:MAG: hypothetical protein DDT34_01108 [Firmicutes bacterium]|nr:hypothetical protein [Bacillota bacterium]